MHSLKPLTMTLGLIAVCIATSCSSQQTVTVNKAKAQSGLDKFNSNYDYAKDENGLLRATSNQQSQYSRKRQFSGSDNVASGANYDKKSYRKKRWGQKSNYNSEQYQGNTDYDKTPFYVQQARANREQSRFSQNEFAANDYSTGTANAASGARRNSNVKHSASGYVTSQQDYPDPLILSKDDYTKLSVQQTNVLLGRE